MKSIWYFVGLTLLIMGGLIVVAGIIDYVSPPARLTLMASAHPALWWGLVMIVFGGIFILREPKAK
jgi:FtsH-binding integral membrane protein